MFRRTLRALALLIALAWLLDAAAGQQPPAFDRVTVRDKKDGSTKNYNGTLKVVTGGLQITQADNKSIIVSPADVIRVVPAEANLPGVAREELNAQLALEDKKTKADLTAARLGYLELLKKAQPKSKQFLDFRIAQVNTRLADEVSDEDGWLGLAAIAAKSWNDFLVDYKIGWELWPAARAGSRVLAELNKFDEAARMWGRLTKPDVELPADLRQEAAIQEIDAQIRSKAFANAAVAAKTMGDAANAGTAAKEKLAIYELAAKAGAGADYDKGLKAIEEKIAATKDRSVQGVGYAMRGELFLLANKPREAMWEFLWVETVFNQDRDEAFKAMCRLVEAFKAQGDEDHVKAYREKMRRFRSTF